MSNPGFFKYEVGGETRYADPYEVEDKFNQFMESLDREAIENWLDVEKTSDDRLRLRGLMKIKPVIAKVFGLPEMDPSTGEGMTSEEIIDVWFSFREWQIGLKKNTDE